MLPAGEKLVQKISFLENIGEFFFAKDELPRSDVFPWYVWLGENPPVAVSEARFV